VKGPDGNVNYVHLQEDADEGRYNDDSDKDGQSCSCYNCFWWIYDTWRNQLCDFIRFYTNLSLLRWSLWWAFAMCGMLQVGNYVQSLWKVINIDNHDYDAVDRRYEMNGLVEGMTDLGAAAMALLASLLRVDWSLWGELTMGSLSLLAAIVLMVSSYTGYVWLAYMCHVMFRSTYAFIITIASSQIAVHVDYESYGLIFGFNTFIALVLQTILTLILETWLNVSIRLQFIIYGGYYYILTLIFIFAGVYKLSVIGWITSLKSCCGRPRRLVDVTLLLHVSLLLSGNDYTSYLPPSINQLLLIIIGL
jgi:thiamine transporter 2/3